MIYVVQTHRDELLIGTDPEQRLTVMLGIYSGQLNVAAQYTLVGAHQAAVSALQQMLGLVLAQPAYVYRIQVAQVSKSKCATHAAEQLKARLAEPLRRHPDHIQIYGLPQAEAVALLESMIRVCE